MDNLVQIETLVKGQGLCKDRIMEKQIEKDAGVRATRRVRVLELHHAIASLERVWQLIDDELRTDIGRVLENARDVLELSVTMTEPR